MASLVGVQAPDVEIIWPRVSAFIQRALKENPGTYSEDDIKRFCLNRDMQLWMILNPEIKGAGVTQIINYPQQKVCLILLLSGKDFASWGHVIEDLALWAKQNQCDAFEIQGRPGWEKVLKWKKSAVILRKEL